MKLTAEEKLNCEKIKKSIKYRKDQTERREKIIDMLMEGETPNQIQGKIGGAIGGIQDIYMMARRRGVI